MDIVPVKQRSRVQFPKAALTLTATNRLLVGVDDNKIDYLDNSSSTQSTSLMLGNTG